MKKLIITPDNLNGTEVELTSEEISIIKQEGQEAIARMEAIEEEKTAKENLKASAKAKLIAGEPLTKEEADTIVF